MKREYKCASWIKWPILIVNHIEMNKHFTNAIYKNVLEMYNDNVQCCAATNYYSIRHPFKKNY